MKHSIPNNWGLDHFSEFTEIARRHLFETIGNFPQHYSRITQIDAVFKTIQENLDFSSNWLSALFFLRSHSSFLCGSSISLSGQLPEAYMVLRGCLENAIYGFWFNTHKKDAKIWFNRNERADSKKEARDRFKMSALLSNLKSADRKEGSIAEELYARTIDFGAHPNQLSLTSTMEMLKTEDAGLVSVAYISGNSLANELCLKTALQIGICSLNIFGMIFRERYTILGVDKRISELKQGL